VLAGRGETHGGDEIALDFLPEVERVLIVDPLRVGGMHDELTVLDSVPRLRAVDHVTLNDVPVRQARGRVELVTQRREVGRCVGPRAQRRQEQHDEEGQPARTQAQTRARPGGQGAIWRRIRRLRTIRRRATPYLKHADGTIGKEFMTNRRAYS
jgi:hypothetical protein